MNFEKILSIIEFIQNETPENQELLDKAIGAIEEVLQREQDLVDENARTVSLVTSIPVAYSPYVSSSQELHGQLIANSGMQMSWSVYNLDGTLLRTYQTTGGKFLYRVLQYDLKDYLFQ